MYSFIVVQWRLLDKNSHKKVFYILLIISKGLHCGFSSITAFTRLIKLLVNKIYYIFAHKCLSDINIGTYGCIV